jgi:hypothetical protein
MIESNVAMDAGYVLTGVGSGNIDRQRQSPANDGNVNGGGGGQAHYAVEHGHVDVVACSREVYK